MTAIRRIFRPATRLAAAVLAAVFAVLLDRTRSARRQQVATSVN